MCAQTGYGGGCESILYGDDRIRTTAPLPYHCTDLELAELVLEELLKRPDDLYLRGHVERAEAVCSAFSAGDGLDDLPDEGTVSALRWMVWVLMASWAFSNAIIGDTDGKAKIECSVCGTDMSAAGTGHLLTSTDCLCFACAVGDENAKILVSADPAIYRQWLQDRYH